MRRGFSMLMALAVIILIATISVLVLNLSGKMVSSTEATYRQEQAALLAKSYAELALLSIINQDINTTCISDINSTVNKIFPGVSAAPPGSESNYDIKIHISYLGNNLPCNTLNSTNISTDYNTTSNRSLAAVIIDVFVSYQDSGISPDNKIHYHLRRLNKI